VVLLEFSLQRVVAGNAVHDRGHGPFTVPGQMRIVTDRAIPILYRFVGHTGGKAVAHSRVTCETEIRAGLVQEAPFDFRCMGGMTGRAIALEHGKMQGRGTGFTRRIIMAFQAEIFLCRGQESGFIGPVSGMADRAFPVGERSMDLRESTLVCLLSMAGDAKKRFCFGEKALVVTAVRIMALGTGAGRIGVMQQTEFFTFIIMTVHAHCGFPVFQEMQLG
jgi:hypothetical protein